MTSWQRLIYILCLALVEATPAALPLALAGAPGAWGMLIFIVLAGALADWLAAGWLPVERQRPALLAAGLMLAAWSIKVAVGAGAGLLSGWEAAFGALFSLTSPNGGKAYLTLLIALYAFRRGTRLLDHDSISLRRLFARASVGLLLILGIVGLAVLRPSDVRLTLTTVMLLTFFAVGLLAIALAAASEEHDTRLSRLGWRGLFTLAGAIALVLGLGLLFAALFGKDAAQALRTIAQAVILLIALICLPLLLLLEGVLERIASMINLSGLQQLLARLQQQQQQQQTKAAEPLDIFPPWVGAVLQVFFALLPILIIIALYLLVRRRARREPSRDEERESLWSWSGLRADLHDLLAGLRRSRSEEGLRAALARLHGADPASRIRRSYIRLLLAGETHERPRAAPQTPREYAPEAGAMLPAATRPIAALTEIYERARYHPTSATSADADAAERAWGAIEDADRNKDSSAKDAT
jgi:Domain of unknown function (DUF4129)